MHFKHIMLSIGALILLAGCARHQEEQTEKPSHQTAGYQLFQPKKEQISQTLKLPAQLAAYMEVSVFPKVNGYVQTVPVDIGTSVKKGQLLMTLEAPEVQQAAAQAKEQYEKAKLDFALSKDNYARLLIAAQTAGAIAQMELATARSKMESDSTLCNAEKANWQMQETLMSYLQITAPFDGVITERNTHPGALINASSTGKALLELKQVNHLRLQVDVPESIAATLKLRDSLAFFLTALPGKKMQATVSRKSGNVNLQYRTERIELDVPNPEGNLAPGMYAEVLLHATSNPESWIVPKSAVVTSTERRYVIAARNKKAVKVDVSLGLSNAREVEIKGNLKADDQLLQTANDEIEEGINLF